MICGALLLAPGCSKKSKGGDKSSKGASSGKSVLARVQGDWHFDADRMKELDPDMKKMSPEQLAKMKTFIKAMKLTITKDKVIMNMGGKIETDTFRVKSDKGNTLVMVSKDKKGVESTVTLVLHNDKSMTGTELKKSGKTEKFALTR